MHDGDLAPNRGANERLISMDLLQLISDRPDGDALCIMQAAAELPGTLEERLTGAYEEIVGRLPA